MKPILNSCFLRYHPSVYALPLVLLCLSIPAATANPINGDLTVNGSKIIINDGTDHFEIRNGPDGVDFWHADSGQWIWSHGTIPTDVMSLDSTNVLSLYDLGASSMDPAIILNPGDPGIIPPSIKIGGNEVLSTGNVISILNDQGYLRLLGGGFHIPSTTTSYSSTTGALTVAGGLGVVKDSWFNEVRVGKGAGGIITNTSIGRSTLNSNSSGSNNTAAGNHALAQNTIGSNNSAFGAFSQQFGTSGGGNSSYGSLSLRDNSAANNTAIGSRALFRKSTGGNNTVVGFAAGDLLANNSILTSISNSVLVGANTRAKTNGEQNVIVIGDAAVSEGSNTTVIGNTSTVSTHLRGETHVSALRVTGAIVIEQVQGDISMGIYGN